MAQIIRMTEEDLKNIIIESVTRILNEGDEPSAWQTFKTELNPKGIFKYAKHRLFDLGGEHEIDADPEEEKRKEWNKKVNQHLKDGGTIDTDGNLIGSKQQSQNQGS